MTDADIHSYRFKSRQVYLRFEFWCFETAKEVKKECEVEEKKYEQVNNVHQKQGKIKQVFAT